MNVLLIWRFGSWSYSSSPDSRSNAAQLKDRYESFHSCTMKGTLWPFLGVRSFSFISCLVCLIKDGWHNTDCCSHPLQLLIWLRRTFPGCRGTATFQHSGSTVPNRAAELFVEGCPKQSLWTRVLCCWVWKETIKLSFQDMVLTSNEDH